jgi:ABC-2 type transport system ATP-binding protein
MTSQPPPVRVMHVSKRFEGTHALDDVSLDVGAGEVFGLLGPNGAGKTTLIRTILDIMKPDSGTVEVFGRRFAPEDRNRIGYLPEERGIYQRQTVRDVLEYLGALKGLSPSDARTRAARWLERLELSDTAQKKVESLSKGNQQKIQIAATILASPPIVILDEPLSGLDPVSARLANSVIRDYAAEGHTVILSTHQMAQVETLCTRVFMIARGRRVLYGGLREIKREHATGAIRVVSTARYEACPLIASMEPVSAGGAPAVDVHLKPPATPDDLLQWLAAQRASVERFEKLDTPLEDIFVRAALHAPAEAAG